MSDKQEIIRLNRTKSYKVIKKTKAKYIAKEYELSSEHHNHLFILQAAVSYEDPRPIRDFVHFLKTDIAEMIIYVLQLQSAETRLIKSKPRENTVENNQAQRYFASADKPDENSAVANEL